MQPDILPLRRIDHVRFFVGNARQSAYFYRNAFGFDVIAYAGLETKTKHEAGYVLRQGDITFVLASPAVTAVSPNTGSTSGGTSVTITGTSLIDVSSVFFGSSTIRRVAIARGSGYDTALSGKAPISAASSFVAISPGN